MNIIVLISANAEWRAVKPLFPNAQIEQSPFGEYFRVSLDNDNCSLVTFFHGGWGKISAAATAQYVLDRFQPDLLVNLGTCGGFEGRIETGTILLVEKTIVYDILEQMGDPEGAIAWVADKNRVRCLILRGVTDLVGSGGGEAYGNFDLFQQRTNEVMRQLVDLMRGWLVELG